MKTNNLSNDPKGKAQQKPEIRDNLDSRKSEEQLSKGDDRTHNEKEQHGQAKSKK